MFQKNYPFLILTIYVTTSTAACGTTTNFTATNTSPRPMTSRAPDSVDIFTSGKPDKSFVEVGIIEAQQSSEFSTHNMNEIIATLRGEAAKKGCDGIIITDNNNATTGDADMINTLKGYRGACIMYK